MTVNELHAQTQAAITMGHGEDEVKIDLNMASIGPRASSGVDTAYLGFDWDHGSFHISPSLKLVLDGFRRDDPKTVLIYEDKVMSRAKGRPYLIRYCPRCQNSVKKNQRYCSVCGQALSWEG